MRNRDERTNACVNTSNGVRKRKCGNVSAASVRSPVSRRPAITNKKAQLKDAGKVQKTKSVTFSKLEGSAPRTAASTSNGRSRKTSEKQRNYIRNFPSIMHLINEYPHIKQLLEETAADKDNPVEMFSTHFLSAMLIPESESLQPGQYVLVNDQWRQEWARGVQVPVNMHKIPEPKVVVHDHARFSESAPSSSVVSPNSTPKRLQSNASHEAFRLPSKRYLNALESEDGQPAIDGVSTPGTSSTGVSEKCMYDADRLDVAWLDTFNASGKRASVQLTVGMLERLIEVFEVAVNERLRAAITQQESFFRVQFDQSVACDVCRSPKAADAHGNAMVFCDACNVCVHQLCYGVKRLPAETESWLCAPCTRGVIAPACVLCGFTGGALKSLELNGAASGRPSVGGEWAHLSCALWLPEYSIGDADKMAPVTMICPTPADRRGLKCGLCNRSNGMCISCSRANCTESFHVTCGMVHGLRFRAVWRAPPDNSVQQIAFCRKHSQPPIGIYSPPRRSAVESVAAHMPFVPSSPKRPAKSAALADTKRAALARTYRSRSRSSSTSSDDAEAAAAVPLVDVIPQETITKCYRELQERVAAIRERFERAAHSVIDSTTLESLATRFGIAPQAVRAAYGYWLLKRRTNRGRPLLRQLGFSAQSTVPQSPTGLSPRSPDTLLRPIGTAIPGSSNFVVTNSQATPTTGRNRLAVHAHTFIGLRRNLERLRNLTYLLIRRERLRRAVLHTQEEVLNRQIQYTPKLWRPLGAGSENAQTENNEASTRQLLLTLNSGKSLYDNDELYKKLMDVYECICKQQLQDVEQTHDGTVGSTKPVVQSQSQPQRNRIKQADDRRKNAARNKESAGLKRKLNVPRSGVQSKRNRNQEDGGSHTASEAEADAECDGAHGKSSSNDSDRPAGRRASERETESDADKENRRTIRRPASPNRKRTVLAERRCSGTLQQTVNNRRVRVTERSRNNSSSSNSGNGHSSPSKVTSSEQKPARQTRPIGQAKANNAARQVALKKLKISMKVNMRNMQLRPRNGLILKVHLPSRSQRL